MQQYTNEEGKTVDLKDEIKLMRESIKVFGGTGWFISHLQLILHL